MTAKTRALLGTRLVQVVTVLTTGGCGGLADPQVGPLIGSPVRYELSVELNGDGSVDTMPAGSTFEPGTEVTLTASPGDSCRFVEWQANGEVLSEGVAANKLAITMDGDRTVTAVFVEQHDLTTEVLGEGSIEPSSGRFDEAAVIVVTASPANGFRFVGWELTGVLPAEAAANPELMLTMDDDKTVTAVFVAQYELRTFVSGGGMIEPAEGTFDEGAEVQITATAQDGFVFDRWDGDVPADRKIQNPLTIVMDRDILLTAAFVPLHDLMINVNGGGTVDPPGGTFTDGTVLTITAVPIDGFEFDHWTGDAASDENPIVQTMYRDMAITAVFVPLLTLTVTAQGQGTVDPSGGRFAEGTRITVVATASPGHVFDRWLGDADASDAEFNPLELEFDGDKNVTAVFVQGIRPGLGLDCINLGDTADRVVQRLDGLYATAPDPQLWVNYLAYENLGIGVAIEDINRNGYVDGFEPVVLVFATAPFSGTYLGLGVGAGWDNVASVMGPPQAIDSPYHWYCTQGVGWTVVSGVVTEVGVLDPFNCQTTSAKATSSAKANDRTDQRLISGARAALKGSK